MEDERTKELSELVVKTLEYKKKEMITRSSWGSSITFEEGKEDFDKVFTIVSYLKTLPLTYLTDNAIRNISTAVKNINDHLEKIDVFSVEAGDPSTARTTLVTQLHAIGDALYEVTAPWIPFLAYQSGDIQANVKALSEAVGDAKDKLGEAEEYLDEKKTEIEEIVTATREAAGKAGAAVFNEEFQKEATEKENEATPWLRAAGGLAILTITTAALMWYNTKASAAGTEFQILGTKFVILGMLFAVTVWCGRMYKSLMHQSAISKHKAMGLQTFQAFSSAADDPTVKDAVLLETTRSIFMTPSTGLVDTRTTSGDGITTKVIETVKAVRDKG